MFLRRCKRCIKNNFWFVFVLIFIASLQIFSYLLLRSYGAAIRFIPQKDLSAIFPALREKTPFVLQQLAGLTVQETLCNVMNFVSVAHPEIKPQTETIAEFVSVAQQGGSLNCNGMADLFLHVLHSKGTRSRKVFINQNFGDFYNSHTTVEVLQEGRWVIFDPTFNSSFMYQGKLLGVQEMIDLIHGGDYQNIQPLFYGEVAYPARLEKYPVNWISLYNNMLIFDIQSNCPHHVGRRGVLCLVKYYWCGPMMYYYASSGPNQYLEIFNILYFIVVFLLPLLGVIIFLSLLGFRWRKNKRKL